MSPSYLNSVFAMVGKMTEIFKRDSVEKILEEYKDAPRIVGGKNIPDLIEVPLQTLLDNGFTIKTYIKTPTDSSVDLANCGAIIFNIQHEDIKRCLLRDTLTTKLDEQSEIEISTAITNLIHQTVPTAFGKEYEIEKLIDHGSTLIDNIRKKYELDKKLIELQIKKYNENPELARKTTKKAIENLKYKQKMLNSKKEKTQAEVNKFQEEFLRIVGDISIANGGVADLESFKQIPEIKEEIEKGSDISKILDVIEVLYNTMKK